MQLRKKQIFFWFARAVLLDNGMHPVGLNIIYFLLNQISNPSFHYNHLDKLFIIQIVNRLKTSHHNITMCKVRAHTKIVENDKLINWPNEEQNNPHCKNIYPQHPHNTTARSIIWKSTQKNNMLVHSFVMQKLQFPIQANGPPTKPYT